MPKSKKSTKKTKKGGSWYDPTSWSSGTSSGSSWTSGLSSYTPSWLSKKEEPQPQPSYGAQPQPQVQPQPSYGAQPQPQAQPQPSYGAPSYGMGGKKRRTRRGKRGGSYSSNMSQTNLAASASPVSGIQTVKAQTWVGGKTKRCRHKHNKSCKH
jgi:hypothetical protein